MKLISKQPLHPVRAFLRTMRNLLAAIIQLGAVPAERYAPPFVLNDINIAKSLSASRAEEETAVMRPITDVLKTELNLDSVICHAV